MKNKEVNFYITPKLLKGWLSSERFVVAHGGRGSAKSMGAGALCIMFATQNPNSRILCVRGTQNKISESSLQVLKDIIDMMDLSNYFISTEHTLKCVNGTEFLFYGAKNYQSFKSLQGINLVWCDEATELSKSAWEILIPSIREDGSRFIVTFNPEKKTDWVYENFITNKYLSSYVAEINYDDNDYFPSELQAQMEWDKATNIAKYNHIWLGQLNEVPEGALWNYDLFQYEEHDEFDKIVVAIDPSGTSKSTSDACGLVVSGKNGDTFYVLDDATGIMSPKEWASKAVALYHKYEADEIVYESNFGGDMTRTIIQSLDKSIPVKEVRATRGKLLRAEPIVFLYQQGKVFHTKKFKDLEWEMCTYSGSSLDRSPNRLDACVYSLSALSISKKLAVSSGMNFQF